MRVTILIATVMNGLAVSVDDPISIDTTEYKPMVVLIATVMMGLAVSNSTFSLPVIRNNV